MRPFGQLTNVYSPAGILAQDDKVVNLIRNQKSKVRPTNEQIASLEQNQRVGSIKLTQSENQMRQKLLKWVIAKCRLTLQLRISTIQHCIGLFDAYIRVCGGFNGGLNEMQLCLLACLFLSCKYMEIYPPSITDFEYVCSYKFLAKDILQQEIIILRKVDYHMNFPLVSDWIYVLSGQTMPQLVLICIPKLPSDCSYRKIAEQVISMGLCELDEQLIEEEVGREIQKRLAKNIDGNI